MFDLFGCGLLFSFGFGLRRLFSLIVHLTQNHSLTSAHNFTLPTLKGVVAPMVAHFHSGYNAREKINSTGSRTRFWAQDGYILPSVMPYDVQLSGQSDVNQQADSGSFLLNAPRAEMAP